MIKHAHGFSVDINVSFWISDKLKIDISRLFDPENTEITGNGSKEKCTNG